MVWTRSLLVLVLVLLSAGCRPLYVPPIPEPLVLPDDLRVVGKAELVENRPSLRFGVVDVPREGWLAIQWFGPDNREKASESVWIDPTTEGQTYSIYLPPDVEVEAGRWRAIVSFEGMVARQFSIEVHF